MLPRCSLKNSLIRTLGTKSVFYKRERETGMSTIVLGTIDAGGDGKAVLMASVNSVLGSSYTLAQFDFGVPELVGVALPTRNSVVKLAPKAASGYYGTRKVYYNRIHASDLGVISVQRGAATRVSDLLESINEKYGILITVEDIYDALLPVGSGEVSIALDFRPSSFVYYGGTYVAIGTNDPNGGTGGGVSAPFVRTQTLFGFDTETLDSDWIKVDGFSVAVDADKSRKRYASMNDKSLSFTNVEKRTWDPNWYDDSVGMQPVVGGFTLGNGSVRTVDAYGRVMELDAVSTGWGGEVGDVMSGVDMSDRNTLQLVQQKLPVRLVLQSSDTTVYVLKVWDNTAQWVRSTDNGVTWSVVGGLNAGITKLLNYTEHDSYDLQIVDSLVHNEVIFCLLRSESGDWSVESFNIGSGECTVSNISVAVGYGSQELDYSSRCRMSLMAPTATMTSPLIAMVAHLDDANQPALYIAEKVGNNYTPYAVASGLLEFDFLTDSAQYVTGYSVPLAKNPAWRLDVIELGTHVPTPIGDAEYASAHRKRTVNGFMTYGLKTLTSIHNGTARSKWVESDLALPGVHTPKSLRLYSAGKFMQYHAQPENALVRVNYTENTAAGGFVGTVDNSIVLEKNNQYRKLSPFGLAPYTSPVLTENSVMNYQWLATSDVDSAKAAIEYSYIAKTAAGVRQWWVAGATGVPLTLRSFGIGYSNIGTVPVAVGNMDNDLLALTDGQTIHRSSDAGRHWTTFTGARSYYQQRNDIANQDVVSTGVVPWVSDSIKSGSFLAESAIFEVDHAVSAGVMERNAKAFNTPWVLTNHGLLRFSTDVNMQSDEHQTYALGVSYGINYLEENQPFRLRHWETDANNNIVLGGDYTVNALAPYAISDENIPPTHTVPVGATLVDIKRSIGYMDSTEFLLIKAANGKYTLECLRESGAVNVFELFGGTRLATSAFIPQVSFFLWDHQDTNYVPLVYCANKSVVLVERITEDTNFAVNIYHLTVPQDNGTPLIPVPMLNKNRREYQFYQKGNGIFGLVYAYNNISKSVTFTLNKLFSLSDAALNTAVVLHGCKMTTDVAVPPTDAFIPTYPAAGTLVSFACSGTTKVGTYNDGNGGVYQQNIEVNSPDCGYIAPTPGPVEASSATITINSETSEIIHTDTITSEEDTAYIVYEFSNPLDAATSLVFDVDFNAEASPLDIESYAWRAGTGAWTVLGSMPSTINVPQGTPDITLRVTYEVDATTEGEEHYDVILDKAPGNIQITSNAIVTTMTIEDTSTGAAPMFFRTAMLSRVAATNGVNVTQTTADENSFAYVTYDFDRPLDDTVVMSLAANFNAEAIVGDITETAWRSGAGAWNNITLPATITVDQGVNDIAVRLKFTADTTTEGDESFDLILDKLSGNTQILNPAIHTTITIADTSTNAPKHLSFMPGSSTTTVDEGGTAILEYRVSEAPDIPIWYTIALSGTATMDDIDSIESTRIDQSENETGWTTLTMPANITIMSYELGAKIRIKFKEDTLTEGEEQLTVTLNRGYASTEFDGVPVTATITIADTSLTPSSQKHIVFNSAASTPSGDEGTSVDVIFDVSDPEHGLVVYDVTFGGDFTTGDLDSPTYRLNFNGNWSSGVNMSLPTTAVGLSENCQGIKFTVPIRNDSKTEGPETILVSMTRQAGYTEFADETVSGSFVINDTSLNGPVKTMRLYESEDESENEGTDRYFMVYFGPGSSVYANSPFDIAWSMTGDVTVDDIEYLYFEGTTMSAYTDYKHLFPSGVANIPAFSSRFVIRVKFKEDFLVEGTESVTFTAQKTGSSTEFDDTIVTKTITVEDIVYSTTLYEDNYETNNKSFDAAPYLPNEYGKFYDPELEYADSEATRGAIYDNVNHQLVITQPADINERYGMMLYPNNKLSYKAREMLFSCKFSVPGITVMNDLGELVLLPAGETLPEGYTYMKHWLGINFINETDGSTGGAGFVLKLTNEGDSSLSSNIGAYRSNGYSGNYYIGSSPLEPVKSVNGIILPNLADFDIKVTVRASTWNGTERIFNLYINGIHMLEQSYKNSQINGTKALIPALNFYTTAWPTINLKQFKIETP